MVPDANQGYFVLNPAERRLKFVVIHTTPKFMRTFRRFLKKFFRQSRKFRDTGYYWVQHTYDKAGNNCRSWRIGWYNELLEYWHIDGEDRFYYDNDFIQIDERKIPRQLPLTLEIIRAILLVLAIAVLLSFLITELIKTNPIIK